MGQIDENVIKKLDRVLLKGSPVLYVKKLSPLGWLN